MAVCTANFESGVNGSNLSVADPGSLTAWDAISFSANGHLTYSNAHVAFGSLAAKIDVFDGTGEAFMSWRAAYGTVTEDYGRFYLYMEDYPATDHAIIFGAYNGSNTSQTARLDIKTDGTIRILDTVPNFAYGVVPVALDQLVRIEWHIVHSTTVGQFEVKLFNSASSATPSETITSPANWNTAASADRVLFGVPTAGYPPYQAWLDNIVAGASSYPGAYISRRDYKRLSGPAQLSGSAADLYTCPPGVRTRVLGIHASNPTGGSVDLNLSIGADGAGTRVYDGYAIAGDSYTQNFDPYDLAAGEKIQGWASSAGAVVLTISGWEQPA